MNQQLQDAQQIGKALEAGRRGGASVTQLAIAHELAEKHGLSGATAELRRYIRNAIPDPENGAVALGRTIGLGVLAGLMTHVTLRLSRLRPGGAA
jgi:hypothetical protein